MATRNYFNVQAELDLISILARKPDVIFSSDIRIKKDVFSDPSLVKMYRFILNQLDNGNSIIVPSLYSHAPEQQQEFQKVIDRKPPTDSYVSLVKTLNELKALRDLRDIGNNIVNASDNGSDNFNQMVEKFGGSLSTLQLSEEYEGVGSISSDLDDYYKKVLSNKEYYDSGKGIPIRGPITYTSLDDSIIGGLEPNDVAVVAAYTSVGKTEWTIQFAVGNLMAGMPVAMFSLEMSKQQLFNRMLSHITGVSTVALKTGEGLNPTVMKKVEQGIERMKSWKLYVNDTCSQSTSLSSILAKSKKLKFMEKNLGLIIIDYLTLVRNDVDIRQNDSATTGAVVTCLKQLAGQISTPICLVSQINRNSENEKRPPELRDLKESGDIENGADIVIFLHSTEEERKNPKPRTRVYISKNRNGSLAEIWCENNKIEQRFREVKAIIA